MFWDGTQWIRPAKASPHTPTTDSVDWLATALMVLGLVAVIIPFLPVYGSLGAMSLSPRQALPGTHVTVSMSNLPSRSSIRLAWDGETEGMPSGRASKDGSLTLVFIVPDTPTGEHEVTALRLRSGGSIANRGSHLVFGSAVLLSATFNVGPPAPTPVPDPASPSPALSQTPASSPATTPTPIDQLVVPSPTQAPTPAPTPAPSPAPTPMPVVETPAPPPAPPAPPPLGPSPGPAMPPGAAWADGFDGGALDASRWGWDLAMVGTSDNMNRYAMFSTDPRLLEVSGGTLKLRGLQLSDGSWIQSYISTRDRYMQQYGIFRASMKIPSGHALWPAFWMLDPSRYDEMDVIEAYPEPGNPTYTFCMHHVSGDACASAQLPADHATAFHVYEMEWRPGIAIARIDGLEVARHSIPEMRPQFLLLQMAVGVWFMDLAPDGSTPTNPTLEVDWVATWP